MCVYDSKVSPKKCISVSLENPPRLYLSLVVR